MSSNYKQNASHCTSLLKNDIIGDNLLSFCDMLATNLKFIAKYPEKVNFVNKPCTLLAYWIYDQIITHFSIETNTIISESIIINFNKAWNALNDIPGFKGENVCYPEPYSIGTDLWTQWKRYNEYYENYKEIKIKKYESTDECNKYKKYVDSIIELHEIFNGYFNNMDEMWKSPGIFIPKSEYDPTNLISNFNCEELPVLATLSSESFKSSQLKNFHAEATSPPRMSNQQSGIENSGGNAFHMSSYQIILLISLSFLGLFIVFMVLYKVNMNLIKKYSYCSYVFVARVFYIFPIIK